LMRSLFKDSAKALDSELIVLIALFYYQRTMRTVLDD